MGTSLTRLTLVDLESLYPFSISLHLSLVFSLKKPSNMFVLDLRLVSFEFNIYFPGNLISTSSSENKNPLEYDVSSEVMKLRIASYLYHLVFWIADVDNSNRNN